MSSALPDHTPISKHHLTRRELRQRIDHEALGDHLQKVLREGDPTLGWEGDPLLTLAFNKMENRFEIWRLGPSGKSYLVGRQAHDGPVNIPLLIRGLIEADTQRRTSDEILKELDSHNAKVERDAQNAAVERMMHGADKASFYMERAAGHRRLY